MSAAAVVAPTADACSTTAADTCGSTDKHVEFSREDERRLEYLMRQKNEGLLAAEEEAEFLALEEKHSAFIEEGVRRLNHGSPSSNTVSTAFDAAAVASWVPAALTQTAGTVGRAAYFWTSLVGTAVPAIAKKVGLTDHFDHWNFVTDRLILGALPVVTQVGSFGNHLAQLKQQLADRNNQTLGLVVACLGEEEMTGFGVQLLEFARESHWREHVSPDIEYIYLPMIDGTAEVTMEHVRAAVDRLHDVLDVKKQCAYVHCKAGKGRSWMVTMCYLATYGGRSFENAEALVCMARHQVNPSSAQREFAKDFCKKFQADEEAKKLLTESVEPE